MRYDCYDYIYKIWNWTETVYGNYEIFIVNVYLVKAYYTT